MSSEESDFEDFDAEDEGPIVSAGNPELARRMESMRQDMQEIQQRAKQADELAKTALDLVNKKDDRIDDLEAENEELRTRVEQLESRAPDPATKDYSDKTREEKVSEVRVSCCRKAQQNGGGAAIDYNDVMTLFDHHPSAGHTYKLLKLAANLGGFSYEKRDGANDRLRVDLTAVKDETVLSRVNKDVNGGDR